MSKIIEIHIAELVVGNEEITITTNGVGSCVVIVLYDRLLRVGGMAHAILPKKRETDPTVSFLRDEKGRLFSKYVDQSIEMLVEELKAIGGNTTHTVAKLVGGAHMFALLEGDQRGIGFQNTEVARETLKRIGITIETEVVGGTVGRNVRFNCATGIVEITTKV